MAKLTVCKTCGSEIASSAKVCPNCGAKVKKPIYKRVWFWLLIFVVIVGLGFGGSNGNGDGGSGGKEKEPEVIVYTTVDIDDLYEEAKKNAAAAKDKYKGQYIEFDGKLSVIDSDLKYISVTSLTDEWDFQGIHCSLKNSETKNTVKTLSTDQTVHIKGKVTDVGEVLGYYVDVIEVSGE